MNITILGAGSWGLTLAVHLYNKGERQIKVFELFENKIQQIKQFGENRDALPGIKIPGSIELTASLEDALRDCELLIAAIPSKEFSPMFSRIKSLYPLDRPVLNVSKGFTETGIRLSQVIEQAGYTGVAVMSGPSHAEEVSRGIPTAIVTASRNKELSLIVQKLFSSDRFRVYTNDDIIGVELGAAVKNVLALACGIADGLGFGDNTKAALITRGLKEMISFGTALGGRPETFFGLSGMGDLVVTAFSRHSRNRLFGERIGRGEPAGSIVNSMKMVAEGYYTVKGIYQKAQTLTLDMPITVEVHRILYDRASPQQSLTALMLRNLKNE